MCSQKDSIVQKNLDKLFGPNQRMFPFKQSGSRLACQALTKEEFLLTINGDRVFSEDFIEVVSYLKKLNLCHI